MSPSYLFSLLAKKSFNEFSFFIFLSKLSLRVVLSVHSSDFFSLRALFSIRNFLFWGFRFPAFSFLPNLQSKRIEICDSKNYNKGNLHVRSNAKSWKTHYFAYQFYFNFLHEYLSKIFFKWHFKSYFSMLIKSDSDTRPISIEQFSP